MENINWKEDPVIEEIREIREQISRITAGFNDQELLAWYKEQAQAALELASCQKTESPTD